MSPVYPDAEEEGDEGEENPEALRRRKPWGDSAHFCPVVLHEQGVLYPGNEDTAARYRERLYYFSSEEAKDKFTANPLKYTAIGKPLEVCACMCVPAAVAVGEGVRGLFCVSM